MAGAARSETVPRPLVFSRRLGDWRAAGLSVGLVPTMGALHDGHRALIARARRENDRVAVSIFVNPLQFEDAEDLAAYPRRLAADRRVLETVGADLCFAPAAAAMVPPGFATRVAVRAGTGRWEGAGRSGHFEGVATIVARLLGLAGPVRAYFGEKDAQQLAMVRRLVLDLGLPVRVVGCPTVREPDGLPASSRNRRLGADARRAAGCLPRAVARTLTAFAAGERVAERLAAIAAAVVALEPGVQLAYTAVVDPHTFEPAAAVGPDDRLVLAARVASVRLIDGARLGDRGLLARSARWREWAAAR